MLFRSRYFLRYSSVTPESTISSTIITALPSISLTVAENKGDHYVVNGLKCFSTNEPLAGYYFFVASTNPELKTKGLTAFVTKTDVEGLSVGKIENKMGIRPAQVSEMIFKDVIVPVENRLGKEGEGFKITILQYLEGT